MYKLSRGDFDLWKKRGREKEKQKLRDAAEVTRRERVYIAFMSRSRVWSYTCMRFLVFSNELFRAVVLFFLRDVQSRGD